MYQMLASVPHGAVLRPVLYSFFTADVPQSENIETATYVDEIACLASDICPFANTIDLWLQRQCIKSKSVHITFTLRKGECAPVTMGGEYFQDCVKWLGMHLAKRLTWAHHIKNERVNEVKWTRRSATHIQYKDLYWLIRRQSPLLLHNELMGASSKPSGAME